MASKRQRGDRWEFTIKNAKMLDRPIYLTFSSEAAGDAYAAKLEKLLEAGIVPTEHQSTNQISSISQLVTAYLRDHPVKSRDALLLSGIVKTVGNTPLGGVDSTWVDNWISDMKRSARLAPSTIRGKVGALARCTDWGIRKGFLLMPDRPLRGLPDGYAQYSELDAKLGGTLREDVERDRRLEAGEYERILTVIEGGVLPRKQRPLVLDKAALRCMFVLAIETAMRLREQFTLTVDQVDMRQRTIFLDKTKNGSKRQVPLSSTALAMLRGYMPESGRLYPWWSGGTGKKELDRVSDLLSKLFINIFEAAGCTDLKMHDLRHEAICRFYEKTRLTDLQISKISGHRSLSMLRRYSNLRGSDLADALG